jgi:hypothetical protein
MAFDAIIDKVAYWRCQCHCGRSECLHQISVKATRLLRGLTEHCGSLGYRRDPERHKAARAKVPARKRRKIASQGAAAFLRNRTVAGPA